MARKRSTKSNFRWVLASLALAAVGGFAFYVQHEAEGFRNAVSPKYWSERAKGLDEYEPKFAYFKRGARDRKEVCLTIDDGPHGACTESELATLVHAHVSAAFFVVGKRMKQHPDLIRKLLAAGMEVGNHTETHPRLSAIPLYEAKKQVVECEQDFEKIAGRRMTLFRPPGMRENDAVLNMVKGLGYQTVGWNVGAHDFTVGKFDPKVSKQVLDEISHTPEQIADRVLANVKNGSIILLHDQPTTAAALPRIIDAIKKQGYKFVSVSEALEDIATPVKVASNPMLPALRVAKRATPAAKLTTWVPDMFKKPGHTAGIAR
jgi:peptidoglycan/xylan/chitin deacetylase (PgdA/CDA1 family)